MAAADSESRVRLAATETRLAERERDVGEIDARLRDADAMSRDTQAALADERVRAAGLEAALRDERERSAEKLATLTQAREDLTAQFRALAGEALEENRRRVTEQHRDALGTLLGPLGERIGAFEKKVDEAYQKESNERFALKSEVANLQLATARINEDANNLTRALKGEAKTRGNWGEVVLERVLERSGLVRGVEFEVQPSLLDDDGAMHRPDVVIRLPDDKHVVIDSKVSLVAYDRYYAAVDDAGRERAGKAHVQAMREHIKSLGAKNYQARETLDAPDFVAMFVPIEPALGLASSLDVELFAEAWDRKVVLVTPATLLAMLSTVRSLWQREKQTRNAIEIAKQSGALYDEFVLTMKALDEVGSHLQHAMQSYDKTRKKIGEGRGNLIRRVEQLRTMGAKATRELPKDLLEHADREHDEAHDEPHGETQRAANADSASAPDGAKPPPPLTLVTPTRDD